jgi:hypothetical protein
MLLRKSANRIVLDAVSVPVFIEMLAEPYPLESMRVPEAKGACSVGLRVGVDNQKIAIMFSKPASIVPLSHEAVIALTHEISSVFNAMGAQVGQS